MASDVDETVGGSDGLSIIVISRGFDRIHYALVLASAHAALGKACTLFFSLQACHALTKPRADGDPGWACLVGEDGTSAMDIDACYRQRGVATFEELLHATHELGVRFMICEMGLHAADINPKDLRDDLPVEITGAVSFFSAGPPGASMLVV